MAMVGRSCVNLRAIKHVYDVTVSSHTILTTVTSHPDAITEWINGVKGDDVGNIFKVRKIGFEIELHDIFPPIGTVQLCVGRRCLVIQLVPDIWPFPASLSEFLCDYNNIFVGFLMDEKISMLAQQVPIRIKRPIRTVDFMKRMPKLLNNKKKVLFEYGLRSETMENDWGRTAMLSDEQVKYACIDAFFNLEALIHIARKRPNNPAAGC